MKNIEFRWEKSRYSFYLHSRCPKEHFEEHLCFYGKAVFYLIFGQWMKNFLLTAWKVLVGLSKLLSILPQNYSEQKIFFLEKKCFFFQTFSDLSEKFTTSLRKNFGQFFKTASEVSKQKLWEISISEINFLFYHNSWSLRENVLAFYRFPAVQMSKLHFACPKDKFDGNYLFFKKVFVSFTILGLWAKTFPTPGRKTSAGLWELHKRWLKEVFEDVFFKERIFSIIIFGPWAQRCMPYVVLLSAGVSKTLSTWP